MAGQTGAETRATATAEEPEEELLCTICNLTACWKAPGKAPAPATETAAPETAAATAD